MLLRNSRKIKQLLKGNKPQKQASDPLRVAEIVLLAVGTIVTASAAYFAWQAAVSASEQAQSARDALSSQELNSSFKTYLAAWNSWCWEITPPSYHLETQAPTLLDDSYTVIASNSGFDSALFDAKAHNENMQKLQDTIRPLILDLRTFLPTNDDNAIAQATIISDFFFVYPSRFGGGDVKTQLIKASAICHYYTEEQLKWFKDRSHKIKPILTSKINIELIDDLPAVKKYR